MIAVPSGFTTYNTELAKKPIHLVEISQRDALDLAGFDLPAALNPGEAAFALVTTNGQLGYSDGAGSLTVGPSSGTLIRHASSSLGTSAQPGFLWWNAVQSLPIDHAAVTRIYGVARVNFQGTLGVQYLDFSKQGGVLGSWPGGTVDGELYGAPDPVNGQVSALIAIGAGAVALDLANLKFRLRNESSLNVSLDPPYTTMYVLSLGIVVYYDTGMGGADPSPTTTLINTLDPFAPIVFTNRKTGVPWQRDWIREIQDQATTISPLDGGAELGEFTFSVQDVHRAITASFPHFIWEGKKVRVYSGFEGQDAADYRNQFALLWTGVIDKIENVNANNEYQLTCTDNKSALSKVIYTVGDDGQPTDSSHPRTLNGHPLDILLHILTDQIGYPLTAFNWNKIQTLRDTIFAGLQFQFSIDSPPAAKDFIEAQLLKPLAGYLWTDNQGRLTVNFLYPDTLDAALATDANNILEVPEAGQVDLINVLSFRFDKDSQGKFLSVDVEQYQPSIDKYGQFGDTVIEADGVRSSLQGFFTAGLTAHLIFLWYASKGLKFEPLRLLWTCCPLEPGDIITVTHALIPNRAAGTLGISGKKFFVLDRTWNFQECAVEVLAIDASFLAKFGAYKIAPDAEADYVPASAPDKARYMFLCNDSDQYSNGDIGHILG